VCDEWIENERKQKAKFNKEPKENKRDTIHKGIIGKISEEQLK
jgi:hypothetical protein